MAAPSQTSDSISWSPVGRPGAEVLDPADHLGLDPEEHGGTRRGHVQRRRPVISSTRRADQQSALAEASTAALIVGLPTASRSATRDARSSPEATAASTR